MRRAAPLAVLALAAALLLGCGGGSSSEEPSTGSASPGSRTPAGSSARACPLNAGGIRGLRATGVSCGEAQRVALGWRHSAACVETPGASHNACTVRGYRCIATATDRGWSVGCAKPARSIAFTVRRG
jgi:hypothetical protein